MTHIYQTISELVQTYFDKHFQIRPDSSKIVVNETRDEFEGDYTLVVFPLAGMARSKPEALGETLGEYLVDTSVDLIAFNVVKGFLNLSCSNTYWIEELARQESHTDVVPRIGQKKIVLEYSSPNSNKPLHLGHVRNILLGWSVGQILEAVGNDVHFTQIVNDRGVAICKSMLAWESFYEGDTPESTGVKPDHFVGNAYVTFNEKFEEEYEAWQNSQPGKKAFDDRDDKSLDETKFYKEFKNEYYNTQSELGGDTRKMLLNWENKDPETRALWKKLNDWFLEGFKQTVARLNISFDSNYYESETYLIGKEIIQDGLDKGVFYKEPDGSVWIDLTEEGLDKKILLRSDGTAVYMTQDLGTARTRFEDHGMDAMIYTVGNEQEYHFQVLFAILKKIGDAYAEDLYHLSYGMVDLPSGRMKTREGTVVDADDLIEEVIEKVKKNSEGRDELNMLSTDEKNNIFETIGIGALKYYMLRVEARKGMLFNPEESVELKGQTGPYIQNAYVRIQSIKRRLEKEITSSYSNYATVNAEEKAVVKRISSFGEEVVQAAKKYDPSIIASYVFELARTFHRFYHDHSIVHADTNDAKAFRYHMANLVATRLEQGMKLLGIDMPSRM